MQLGEVGQADGLRCGREDLIECLRDSLGWRVAAQSQDSGTDKGNFAVGCHDPNHILGVV